MKLKDYDKTIDLMDLEVATALEKLTDLDDKSSEEALRTAQYVKILQEAKQTETRNKAEHKEGLVPRWATTLIGSALGIFFGGVILREEHKGGVVSSQAINLWDRVIRKF